MATPLAHVVFLLDCSGSMSSMRAETQEAFNTFVRTLQKTKGAEIRLTLIEYRDRPKMIYKAVPIQDVPELEGYRPNASEDILYDAVHYGVEVAEKVKDTTKTVIVILCDGGDTSSRRSQDEARCLVEKKRAEGWEFCFMAAGNTGGFYGPADIARRIGIPPEAIISYAATYGQGNDSKAVEAFSASAWNVGAFSSGRAESVKYTEAQKKAVGG